MLLAYFDIFAYYAPFFALCHRHMLSAPVFFFMLPLLRLLHGAFIALLMPPPAAPPLYINDVTMLTRATIYAASATRGVAVARRALMLQAMLPSTLARLAPARY